MVLMALTGWQDRRERQAVAYLVEENRLLRRQLGGRRLRLTDDDRRRLAVRAYRLGRQGCAKSRRSSCPTHCSGGIGSSSRASGRTRTVGPAVEGVGAPPFKLVQPVGPWPPRTLDEAEHGERSCGGVEMRGVVVIEAVTRR